MDEDRIDEIYDALISFEFKYKSPHDRFKEFIKTLSLDECKDLYKDFKKCEIYLEQIILLSS